MGVYDEAKHLPLSEQFVLLVRPSARLRALIIHIVIKVHAAALNALPSCALHR